MSTSPISPSTSATSSNQYATGSNLTSLGTGTPLQVTGLASGLNTNAIVTALMQANQQQVNLLTSQQSALNAKNAQALRDALARYTRAARRVSGPTRRQPRGGHRAPANGLNTTEVREWAKAQGIEVKDRGRVPAELVVKFKAATGN